MSLASHRNLLGQFLCYRNSNWKEQSGFSKDRWGTHALLFFIIEEWLIVAVLYLLGNWKASQNMKGWNLNLYLLLMIRLMKSIAWLDGMFICICQQTYHSLSFNYSRFVLIRFLISIRLFVAIDIIMTWVQWCDVIIECWF